MKLRFEELPAPAQTELPSSYVLIGMYAGSSAFPMCAFFVLRVWWEAFARNPEIQVAAPKRSAESFSEDEVQHATSIELGDRSIFG